MLSTECRPFPSDCVWHWVHDVVSTAITVPLVISTLVSMILTNPFILANQMKQEIEHTNHRPRVQLLPAHWSSQVLLSSLSWMGSTECRQPAATTSRPAVLAILTSWRDFEQDMIDSWWILTDTCYFSKFDIYKHGTLPWWILLTKNVDNHPQPSSGFKQANSGNSTEFERFNFNTI